MAAKVDPDELIDSTEVADTVGLGHRNSVSLYRASFNLRSIYGVADIDQTEHHSSSSPQTFAAASCDDIPQRSQR
jgi:hypothetical protein